MENENILTEKEKLRSKYTIPFMIIGGVVIALIAVGFYIVFKNSNPRSTYIKVIDTFTHSLIDTIEDTEKEFNKPIQSKYNISFNLISNSDELNDIATILNKLNVNTNFEVDFNSKKAYMNLGASYNNENMFNVALMLNNQNIYGDLGDLYNKSVKIPAEGIEQIWKMYDFESYETIVKEISDILKDALKEEYFSSAKETIQIDGRNIKTTKHILTLNGSDIYDIEYKLLNDMENNDKIIDALYKLNESMLRTIMVANSVSSNEEILKEDIKSLIANAKEELVADETMEMIFQIYLNNADVIKVSMSDNSGGLLTFTKIEENKYEISTNIDGEMVVLGTLILNNNNTKLTFDYEDVEITYEVSETSINISIKSLDDAVEIKSNIDDNKSDGYISVVSAEADVNLKINFTAEIKNIEKVAEFNVNNYVALDQMTEDDYNNMMDAVYQNSAIMSLVQDIMVLSERDEAYSY